MRTGNNNSRQFKDPDRDTVSKWCEPSPKDGRDGFWTSIDRLEMDAQFRLAMSAAIESGAEHCTTEPSTHFGTRAPIAGYQRD